MVSGFLGHIPDSEDFRSGFSVCILKRSLFKEKKLEGRKNWHALREENEKQLHLS